MKASPLSWEVQGAHAGKWLRASSARELCFDLLPDREAGLLGYPS